MVTGNKTMRLRWNTLSCYLNCPNMQTGRNGNDTWGKLLSFHSAILGVVRGGAGRDMTRHTGAWRQWLNINTKQCLNFTFSHVMSLNVRISELYLGQDSVIFLFLPLFPSHCCLFSRLLALLALCYFGTKYSVIGIGCQKYTLLCFDIMQLVLSVGEYFLPGCDTLKRFNSYLFTASDFYCYSYWENPMVEFTVKLCVGGLLYVPLPCTTCYPVTFICWSVLWLLVSRVTLTVQYIAPANPGSVQNFTSPEWLVEWQDKSRNKRHSWGHVFMYSVLPLSRNVQAIITPTSFWLNTMSWTFSLPLAICW